MCGIAGWFSTPEIDANRANETLQRMAHTIGHRGPDGEGYWHNEHAAFGHVRLSIIDPDGGQQPMRSSDGRVTITFNGEIYNYRALRLALTEKGAHFLSDSDTEVIINLYQIEGLEGLRRLRGMYAFALYDNHLRRGFLVRDPQGIKPLFYKRTAKRLVFGSEAKAILAFDQSNGQLNTNALHLLMNFRYIPGDETLFDGIQQLTPGTILTWQEGNEIRRDKYVARLPYTEHTLRETLEDSVKAHLVSDVEVGAYLSGGIDSAAICALAVKNGAHNLRTFTMDIGDDSREAINALKTANTLGIQNDRGSAQLDPQTHLNKLIWHLEVPKVNALQSYLLAKHASQHVKVALSGLGGDELFYGYNVHQIFRLAVKLEKYSPTVAQQFIAKLMKTGSRSNALPFTEKSRIPTIFSQLGNWPMIYGLLRNVWDCEELRNTVYGERMLDAKLNIAQQTIEANWPDRSSPLEAMARFEWENKMVNDLLWQEDRTSMAHGLEVRVPFVDSYLAHYAWSIPASSHMRSGEKKALLKSKLNKVLPRRIIQRKKSGFQVDAASFFQQQLQPLVHEWLAPEKTQHWGLFNQSFIDKVVSAPNSKRYRWHYFMLYLMIGTHIWMSEFTDER